jgi:hypothetical protein
MLVLPMSHAAAVNGMILRPQGAEITAVRRLHDADVRQTWWNEVEMKWR